MPNFTGAEGDIALITIVVLINIGLVLFLLHREARFSRARREVLDALAASTKSLAEVVATRDAFVAASAAMEITAKKLDGYRCELDVFRGEVGAASRKFLGLCSDSSGKFNEAIARVRDAADEVVKRMRDRR